jgi:hypothetical protein
MPCASFLMIDGPGGTGCNVPVHSCWDSRDVVAAVFDCVKECNCNVFDHLICWLGIVYNVFFYISHIVRWCLVWGLLVVYVKFLGLFQWCMYDEC